MEFDLVDDVRRRQTELEAQSRSPNQSEAEYRSRPGQAAEAAPNMVSPSNERDSSMVFVVHGRNESARDEIFGFLRSIGLRPIEWSQAVRLTGKGSPYVGEVLDVAFSHAQAVVVLMTPDEIAYLRTEYGSGDRDTETLPAPQPRPNVLFEAGIATGRDSARTILVQLGAVRPFSDIAGRHVVRLDNSAPKRKELAQRLETAGCAVDLTGDAWLEAGDLTPPEPPGGSLPLGKRVPAAAAGRRAKLDLRYHSRQSGGRLEIVNVGTEELHDVDLVIPDDAGSFSILAGELPLARLPSGKSAFVFAVRTMGGGGRDNFDVHVVGRTPDGEQYVDEIFLSLAN